MKNVSPYTVDKQKISKENWERYLELMEKYEELDKQYLEYVDKIQEIKEQEMPLFRELSKIEYFNRIERW